MIVSHHPLIFSAVKQINGSTFLGRRILKSLLRGTLRTTYAYKFDVMGMAQLNQASLKLRGCLGADGYMQRSKQRRRDRPDRITS